MRNNRQQIDKFLLHLERFVSKYHKHADDIYDIENTFIPIFKANKDNRTFVAPDKRNLNIPTLAMMCNPYKMEFTRKSEKDKIESKFKNNRTSVFVQSVAYKLEYKTVKDVSYEHIFMKHLLANSEKANSLILFTSNIFEDKLSEYDLRDFLVPVDYDTNTNLIIY